MNKPFDTMIDAFQKSPSLENEPSPTVLPAPELTVVVPTFNESENVATLVDRLRKTLIDCDWEVVFVDDDSPDHTSEIARKIGEQDRRVRCIRRVGRRGLSGACIEGALASQACYIAVMDGDLQHDESCLVTMLNHMRSGDLDLAVATRYVEGGSSSVFSAWRSRFSRWATLVTRRVLGIKLTDPMSGFFMIRRDIIENLATSLMTQGFKILLDIVVTARGKLRFIEIPYSFRKRQHGESKLDARIVMDFASFIIGKLTAGMVSARFILFTLVGLTGLCLHMLLLKICMNLSLNFEVAQTLSTFIVIAYNFSLNNNLTYRSNRLTGSRFLTGLIRFEIVCSVGLISNIGIASWVYDIGNSWWLAGFGGALMGAAWNYAVSAAFVWRQH